ncbi:MAG: hypothetical protein VCF24_04680, partial [Candidatus Latescibacterota bacterium]
LTLAHDPHQFLVRQPSNVWRYIGLSVDLSGFCPSHGASPSQGPPAVGRVLSRGRELMFSKLIQHLILDLFPFLSKVLVTAAL